MKVAMKRQRIVVVCAWLAGAVLATSCTGSGGGPSPAPPFAPFGTEPATVTGTEPTNGDNEAPAPSAAGGSSIAQLCSEACARIEAACTNANTGPNCTGDCSSSGPAGCEAQLKTFLQCINSQPLTCSGGSVEVPPGCQSAALAISDCAQGAT
jgi:hypothetical protein